MKRPSEEDARRAVEKYLELEPDELWFDLVEDGEFGWAFWLVDTDTTSYVHPDLRIEWYGTSLELGHE